MLTKMTSEKPQKKVLVIDDNEDILLLIKQLLETNGYETFTAQNGNIGLSLYEQHQPDLVITDIFMPEIDGLEVIARLLRIKPDLKIIALSGGGDLTKRIDYLGIAMTIGATRFLQKPFEPRTLLYNVQRSLRRSDKPTPSSGSAL